ncbi:MAG TPA: hypothetical protein VNL91_08790 [Thermoanaerobaculia bacterium]|nr:hypothetical protein [Thermoanaerobaculia bacterium]
MSQKLPQLDPTWATHLPLANRVLDRLGDILFASDEILGMVGSAETEAARRVGASIRLVYDEVNELMKELTD